MSKEWLWWLGEFGLAAVVAVVGGFVTKDVPISVLYGLFVGTVFFVLREHKRVVIQHEKLVIEMEDKALNLPPTLRYQEGNDPYLRHLAQTARDEAMRLSKGAANGDVELYSPPFINMMIDFFKLMKPGDKVISTNYGMMAGTPEQDVLRQVSFECVEKGVDITRIFIESITATSQHRKVLREEMDKQKEHIKVRFIKESNLPQEARGHNYAIVYGKRLGDSGWYSPNIRDPRQIQNKIRICSRREEVEKAEEMMNNLIKLSEEYK